MDNALGLLKKAWDDEYQMVRKVPSPVYYICETLSDATVESGRVEPRLKRFHDLWFSP